MPSPMVQAQYENLKHAGQDFQHHHERVQCLARDLEAQLETLKRGAWVGENADRFYAKLEHDLLPGILRLVDALHTAQEVTLQIERILETAEEEAAALFTGDGSLAGAGGGDPATAPSNAGKALERVDSGGNIQTYRLNLNDPNASVQDLLKQIPNSGGRPVIFLVHGWNVSDADARGGFSNTDGWYEQQFGNLPPDQRPILVGVDWASTTRPDSGIFSNAWNYLDIQQRGVVTGDKLGAVMAAYQRENPTAQIGIVAHSMGNVVATNAIQGSDVHVDGYLAVQGVANSFDIKPGGALGDVVNPNRVGHVINTYSMTDIAMRVRPDNSMMPWNLNLPIGGIGISAPSGQSNIENVDVSFGGGLLGHHSFDPTQSEDVAKLHSRLFQTSFSHRAVP